MYSLSSAARTLRGTGGFVVLGPLIAIVVLVAGAVFLGVMMDRARRPPPPVPVPREVRVAARPVQVTFGAMVTRRAAPGEALHVRSRGDGEAVVFESARSNRIIGFVADSVLRPLPATR